MWFEWVCMIHLDRDAMFEYVDFRSKFCQAVAYIIFIFINLPPVVTWVIASTVSMNIISKWICKSASKIMVLVVIVMRGFLWIIRSFVTLWFTIADVITMSVEINVNTILKITKFNKDIQIVYVLIK